MARASHDASRKGLKLLALSLPVLTLWACSGDSGVSEPEEQPGAAELGVAATGDPSIPFLAMHRDGGLLAPMVDPASGAVTGGLFITEGGQELSVELDEDGLPRTLVAGNLTVVFENIVGTQADLAFILPDGTIVPARGVQLPAGVSAAGLRARANAVSAELDSDALRSLQVAGFGVDIATCWIGGLVAGFSGVGTAVGVGILLSCGNATLTFIAEANPDSFLAPMTFSAEAITVGISLTGCRPSIGGALSCVGVILTSAAAIRDLLAESTQSDLVFLARGVLKTGAGEVKFTLTWDNDADLDLWVTDPCGETISWDHPSSRSGGELDVDDTDGRGPENIFWTAGKAPDGRYTIRVDHYAGPAPARFNVFMQRPGDVTILAGSVADDQTTTVLNDYRVSSTVSCPSGAPAVPEAGPAAGAKPGG